MKIFLIIPTLKQGGAERVMSELANEFTNQDHEVHLVLLAKAESFYKIDKSIIVHNLAFENKGGFNRLIAEFKVFVALRNLFKNERPNFILSFMAKYNVFTILANRFLPLKVFVSDRSNPYKKIPSLIEFLRKHTYKYATGIVAQTNTANTVLKKTTGSNHIRTIPNPVREIQEFPLLSKEKIILNIGRLVPEKGQKYLLEAFSKVEDTSWRLVILGEGPLKDELMSQALSLNISERLLMPGSVNNVDEWLAKSSIFAFSSISEGFPNALVEAMAAGLACVSFDCDVGPRDIVINNENGFLVEKLDTSEFSQKLNYLVNNPQERERLGLKARLVSEKYHIEKISKKYLNFFTSSLN